MNDIEEIRTEAVQFLTGRKQATQYGRGANMSDLMARSGAEFPGALRTALAPLIADGTILSGTCSRTGLEHFRLAQ